MAAHDVVRSDAETAGSERNFGLVFAAFFALVALLPALHGRPIRYWALVVCAAFLVAALAAPKTLKPLNLLWFRLGLILHKVVNPIVMALLFFGTITPMAWWLRRRGKSPIDTRLHAERASYWVARTPPGPAASSMSQQF